MTALPTLALSVRQPWAWAIIYAGKDIENRSAFAVRHMSPLAGRRAIHASKGMTREEYEDARDFMASIGVICPRPHELVRGAVIGSVDVAGVLNHSNSRWFFGPRGLVLRNPIACEPVPAIGALGYFKWKPDRTLKIEPARWMLPKVDQPAPTHGPVQLDIFMSPR